MRITTPNCLPFLDLAAIVCYKEIQTTMTVLARTSACTTWSSYATAWRFI
jgi:hypothetical protein